MSINWVAYDEILINSFFFDRGIIVVKTQSSETNLPDKEIICHYDQFSILSIDNFGKNTKYINKQQKFLVNLIKNSLENISAIDISIKMILFNKKRREEIFLPLLLTKEKISIYINAWITHSIKSDELLSFSRVNQFITAGCIFGSRLKAKDQNSGRVFPLINIDVDFFLDKQISSLSFKKDDLSVYESLLFNELDTYAKLIQVLSPDNSRTLFYHFPYYDYILFAAVLLVRNILSYEIFDCFHETILSTSKIYLNEINKIFQNYNINIEIESPYQNIFGNLNQRLVYKTQDLLQQLDIDINQLTSDLSNDLMKKERELIQRCWYKLIKNSLDSEHREIWEYFSTLYREAPNSYKELLERANAMMVARASWGKEHYSTCSLLPHSEKQIQIGYSKLLKSQSEKILSEVINLTVFDPVVAYSNAKNIGLFTCDAKIGNIKDNIKISRGKFFIEPEKNNPIFSPDLSKQKFIIKKS